MAISQTISTLTNPINRDTMTPSEISTAGDQTISELQTIFGQLNTFSSQANSTATAVNNDASTASSSASSAQAAQTAAENVVNISAWSSGTTYSSGDCVYGSDLKSYRSAQGSNINHNPVGDGGTWWVLLGGIQDIVSDTTPQLGGDLDVNSNNILMADQTLSRSKLLDYSETLNALGDLAGGTDDIDLELGNVVSATVSTSTQTFTFSNPPVSGSNGSFTLFLTNGGSQTINWPASVDWIRGTAPTLTASGLDVIVFTTNNAGTIWYGFVAGLDVK